MTAYRTRVLQPLFLDVYLLYVPEVLLVLPYLLLLTMCLHRGSRRERIGTLAVATCLLVAFVVPFRWSFVTESESRLKLVSANVQSWGGSLDVTVRRLKALDPDVLCLQEVWMKADLETFKSSFPEYSFWGDEYKLDDRGSFKYGTMLGVRKALGPVQGVSMPWVIGATIEHKGGKLLILSVHGEKEQDFSYGALLKTAELQAEQARRILSLIQSFEGEAVLAGDFNASGSGPGLKVLRSKFYSAFVQAGRGFGLTFPARFPLTRIDHILGTEGVHFKACRTHEVGSDHLALYTEFSLSIR